MGKVIGGVAVVVVLIGALLWWNGRKAPEAAMAPQASPAVSDTQTQVVSEKKAEPGMMASIKEAMGLGKKMECTYTDATAGKNLQSNVVIDGEKFKSTTVMDGLTVNAVFDGTTQYTWTSKEKQGTKISKECMEEFNGATTNVQNQEQPDSVRQDFMAGFDAAQNVNCKPALAADFSVPTDITFTDQCVMMKQASKMMQQLKGKMPNGAASGNIPSVPAPSAPTRY